MTETPRDPDLENQEQNDEETSGNEGKDEVQEQSEESFPASDPPSF